jgi:hypothetical protein
LEIARKIDEDNSMVDWRSTEIRLKKIRLVDRLAVFAFSLVSTFGPVSANSAFADGEVKLDCFFAVRCEVGSANCELESGTQTYVFDQAHMVDEALQISLFSHSEDDRVNVLVVLNSGESRLLQFQIPPDGGSQSIGHMSFGHCKASK